jgi:hypothetical protein
MAKIFKDPTEEKGFFGVILLEAVRTRVENAGLPPNLILRCINWAQAELILSDLETAWCRVKGEDPCKINWFQDMNGGWFLETLGVIGDSENTWEQFIDACWEEMNKLKN